jgi:hypothetical protein
MSGVCFDCGEPFSGEPCISYPCRMARFERRCREDPITLPGACPVNANNGGSGLMDCLTYGGGGYGGQMEGWD